MGTHVDTHVMSVWTRGDDRKAVVCLEPETFLLGVSTEVPPKTFQRRELPSGIVQKISGNVFDNQVNFKMGCMPC